MTNDKETAQDIFRAAVLEAMDKAAREIFGPKIKRNDAGATDADLPRLFRALDAQLDILAERYNTILWDVPAVSDAEKPAAPELLAALDHICKSADLFGDMVPLPLRKTIGKYRAAIAKATGSEG